MSDAKWTPEPWASGDKPGAYIVCKTDDIGTRGCVVATGRQDVATYWPAVGIGGIPVGQQQANADRIVACVNACAGMADPAREIAELRAEVAQLAGMVAGEYVRGREHERAARADVENAHIAALRDQNAAMRAALESLWARAAEFRQEAIRIRSTIKAPTDAEMRCNVRAELLERLASEFSLTLATKEPTDGKA